MGGILTYEAHTRGKAQPINICDEWQRSQQWHSCEGSWATSITAYLFIESLHCYYQPEEIPSWKGLLGDSLILDYHGLQWIFQGLHTYTENQSSRAVLQVVTKRGGAGGEQNSPPKPKAVSVYTRLKESEHLHTSHRDKFKGHERITEHPHFYLSLFISQNNKASKIHSFASEKGCFVKVGLHPGLCKVYSVFILIWQPEYVFYTGMTARNM